MQRKNFIGFRDRVLLHLLRFEKEVYENIHSGEVDGDNRDFLAHLTQEGIAAGVGTKQSTIYKELQILQEPALEGEEPLINVIERTRIPNRERACSIYYLTPYGHDMAAQKRNYLEKKNLEVYGLIEDNAEIISIEDLMSRLINEEYESNPISALLRIASIVTFEGDLHWNDLISPPEKEGKVAPMKEKEPELVPRTASAEVKNPFFNRTAIKDPKYFYGRQEEIDFIISLLVNTQSCSIVGPRRVGKSSLINHVSNPDVLIKNGLNSEELIFVSIDLEGLSDITQSEFFYMIAQELRNGLTDEHTRSQLEAILQKENIRFLDLKNIFTEISNQGKKVIFLLDEFELITNNKNLDCNFYSGLRNLANTYNVGYITASNVPLLELTLSQETLGSPFFNFFSQLNLGLLDDKSAHDLITGPLSVYGLKLPDNIIEFVKRTAGPHAFFIQILCFHIFNWLKANNSISDSDLTEISKRFMGEAKHHYRYFWSHLSSEEQNSLLKLHDNGSKAAAGVTPTMVQTLKNKALVVEDEKGIQLYSKAFSDFISTEIISKLEDQAKTLEQTDKEVEEEPKTVAKKPELASKVLVAWGNNYLVDEDSPITSVKLYNELTQRDIPGLFITRTQTDKALMKWDLKNSKIIWLCSRSGIGYLRPALEKISHTIFEFIKENKHSVVFVDGIEYIVNNNDFLKTLNLMDNVKEFIAVNNSVLIFPISSTIFSEKEMALLKKNSVEIAENSKLDFSKLDI